MWEQDPPCWPVTVGHVCVDAGPPVDNSRINDRQASRGRLFFGLISAAPRVLSTQPIHPSPRALSGPEFPDLQVQRRGNGNDD